MHVVFTFFDHTRLCLYDVVRGRTFATILLALLNIFGDSLQR